MEYYEFIFETLEEEKRNILLAQLDSVGFEGFEEEGTRLKAYIRKDHFDEISFNDVMENSPVLYSKSIIKEINWNEKWEQGFKPVLVKHPVTAKPFVSVRANFHAPVKEVRYDLVITPKMSFGTGHHATTFLMISQMSLIDFVEKSVIDFGTGTGVLAILAEKLGAREIMAIDNDEWSITNTIENIEANTCRKIKVIKTTTIDTGMKADIILANINLNIIMENIQPIRSACKPGSVALFSGILVSDQDQIVNVLKEASFLIDKIVSRDNWLVICTIVQ